MFAIGIGFGLAEDFRGEAALAAAVAFLGLQAMTGPGALAELFYGHALQYNDDSIHGVIDPIQAVYAAKDLEVLNLTSSAQLTLENGDLVTYSSLLGEGSYFAGKTSLLYFVNG